MTDTWNSPLPLAASSALRHVRPSSLVAGPSRVRCSPTSLALVLALAQVDFSLFYRLPPEMHQRPRHPDPDPEGWSLFSRQSPSSSSLLVLPWPSQPIYHSSLPRHLCPLLLLAHHILHLMPHYLLSPLFATEPAVARPCQATLRLSSARAASSVATSLKSSVSLRFHPEDKRLEGCCHSRGEWSDTWGRRRRGRREEGKEGWFK